MPIPPKYLADFEENCIYHIYNRTNNRERLFLSDENRRFFLKRYSDLLDPFIGTYCWCLLPNHFHLLVRVKATNTIRENLKAKDNKQQTLTERRFLYNGIGLSGLLEQSFKRFFQSYAQAFNKVHQRNGNLFYRPFKRVLVENEAHFTQAIIYIHANAQKHGFVTDFTKYKWSSFESILSGSPTHLLRKEVLDWFGGVDGFSKAHKELAAYLYESDVSMEDD